MNEAFKYDEDGQMMVTTIHAYGQSELGVIFAGTSGQAFNDVRLVALAAEYGYDTRWLQDGSDDANGGVAGPYWDDLTTAEQEDHHGLPEAAYEALEWLNEYSNGAVDAGYSFEWIEGDLCLTEHRAEHYATVSISAESIYTREESDGELDLAAESLSTVRVALPGEECPDVPTQFDWLNSVTIDFETGDDGYEVVTFYASTGDPRGAMRVASLVRQADGSITLAGAVESSVTGHEHYARKLVDAAGTRVWRIR